MLIFVIQSAIGSVLAHWPSSGGHYPAAAHQTVWFGLIVVQIVSAVWYFMPTKAFRPAGNDHAHHVDGIHNADGRI